MRIPDNSHQGDIEADQERELHRGLSVLSVRDNQEASDQKTKIVR